MSFRRGSISLGACVTTVTIVLVLVLADILGQVHSINCYVTFFMRIVAGHVMCHNYEEDKSVLTYWARSTLFTFTWHFYENIGRPCHVSQL